MIYPYILANQTISPIFPNLSSIPRLDSLENNSPLLEYIDKYHPEILDQHLPNTHWGIGRYLEDRKKFHEILDNTSMIEEGRFFHTGIDINVPVKTAVHAPLSGQVVISEYEEEIGHYGGKVVLKHNINDQNIYTLYGHLNKDKLPKLEATIKQSESFAEIGDYNSNGNYFHHLHFQVITQEGFEQKWYNKGYCTLQDIPKLKDLCPDPSFLFKFS